MQVGNGYGIAGAPAAAEREGSGGAPGVPKSAFAAAGQRGGDWDDEEGDSVRDGGGTSSSNLPRLPLHPLPSHGSFTAQLPPRPSELLKVCALFRGPLCLRTHSGRHVSRALHVLGINTRGSMSHAGYGD